MPILSQQVRCCTQSKSALAPSLVLGWAWWYTIAFEATPLETAVRLL